MRLLLFGIVLCASVAAPAADGVSTNGVRNPFWPKGYEGERQTISPHARPRPKPKPEPAKAKAKSVPASRPALTAAEKMAKAVAEKTAKEAAEKEAAERAEKEAAEKKAAAERAEKEAAERAEAERKKREITPAHWESAQKSLSFGSRMTLRGDDGLPHASVVINGKVYADGDLVSITYDSRRFTWRFVGLSDTKQPNLEPVRAKYLEKPGEAGKKSDKGAKP